ncbi:flavin reductase family protein [Tsukamurella sp. 8F]|uniref:flavin reductase family protein n=1 Tax=unclassified Tsukamurella TaxID=2633480 RepID=UPI0023BA2D9C|nr:MULTISPECIES: flavin reductase family protein [unclassified Tsukamurella]MDF0530753.1 flavin reductase family protein [Tsukamurella sp. 8J]MDF0587954.1 flavin reductase family protein [Tsukamurella sp. 8F]
MPSDATSFDPDELDPGAFYRLLTASIVPRPIAWVSTRAADGVLNLAPYSFFTVASTAPPIVQFTSVGHKDSWRNILETGEFVVNIGTESLIEQMNRTSEHVEHGVDEFALAGLTPERSATVAPPRVAEAPVSIECTKHLILDVGNCAVILGAVRHVAVARSILADDGLPDFARLAPPSRLGRSEWGLTPATVEHERP